MQRKRKRGKMRTKIPSEALTKREAEALLSASQGPIADPRLYPMILLAINHGFRVSELCKLRREHINWPHVEIDARAGAVRKTDASIVMFRGKGSASGRHRLLPEELDALKPYLVYPSTDGTLFGLHRGRFYALLRELCESIGLPQSKQSPHALRHTCIKFALARGASLPAVQRFVGHKSLASTGAYTKVSESEAVDECMPSGEVFCKDGLEKVEYRRTPVPLWAVERSR